MLISSQIIIFLVVAIYLLGMLFIGIFSSRAIKGIDDFFVAGRKLGVVLATATLFATWFGACSSMGTAGTVYRQGTLGVISDPFGASLALILAGLFYVAAFRKLKFLTVLDIFGKFYSKPSEIFAAILMIPVYIGWLGSQIVAIGLIFSSLTKFSPQEGMLIGGFVTLIYTYTGGMWAVTLTDFFQMFILVAGLLLIFPSSIKFAGGFTGIFKNTPAEFFRILPGGGVGQAEWLSYFGKWLIMGLGCIVGQDLIQRSLSSKDEKVARISAITAGILYFLMGGVVIFIALAGRLIFPALENSELLIPLLAQKFLSPFFLAIFISGLLAAIMSSADSSLLAAVSLFINNVLRPLKENIEDKKLLRISKLTTIITMILSVVLALYVGQVYNLMVNSWATLLVSLFVPITIALFFRKIISVPAGWASMIGGLVVWVGYIIYKTGSFDINDNTMEVYYIAAFYGFIVSILSYFFVFCGEYILKKLFKN